MRIIPIILLILCGQLLSAQHCGYCGAAILVVRPHAAWDSTVVDGLRITLLDSTNLPVTHGGAPFPPFYRNDDPDSYDAPGVNHRRRNGEPLFPFAKDNYVLVIGRGMDLRGCSILVQDERTWRSGTVFGQTTTAVPMDSPYGLCGQSNAIVLSTGTNEAPYTVIDIPLQRR